MPNHIINKVTLKGGNVKEVLAFIKSEETEAECNTIDFNKIIPMPTSLNIESGSKSDTAFKYAIYNIRKDNPKKADEILNIWNESKYFKITEIKFSEREFNTISENLSEMLNLGKTIVDNLINYGCADWYDWRVKNWGTKWGAYNFLEGEDNQIIFYTAWNAPLPIYATLCRMFPNTTFEIDYADEDIGHNAASIVAKGDDILSQIDYDEEDEADAVAFAENLWGY